MDLTAPVPATGRGRDPRRAPKARARTAVLCAALGLGAGVPGVAAPDGPALSGLPFDPASLEGAGAVPAGDAAGESGTGQEDAGSGEPGDAPPVLEDRPGPPDAAGWHERPFLTGSWGGSRDRLEELGIGIELAYTLDLLGTVAGGVRRGFDALGNADLVLEFDPAPLTGWEGGRLLLYGLGNHGTDPTRRIGDLQVISSIEAFDTWKLYEAWWEQRVLDGRLSFLLGLYDLNREFDVLPEAFLFLHSSAGLGAVLGISGRNGPSSFPVTSLGTRVRLDLPGGIYALGAALDGVPGDPAQPRGTQVVLREDDGLLLAGELGVLLDPQGGEDAAPDRPEGPRHYLPEARRRRGLHGRYAVGVFGYTTDLEDLARCRPDGRPELRGGSWGIYLNVEQRLVYESAAPRQGLSALVRLGRGDDRATPVESHVAGGLVYDGLLPRRPFDRLGLLVAAARTSDGLREAAALEGRDLARWEVAFELTYQCRFAPWLAVQPVLFHVVRPGGRRDIDDAVTVGVRLIAKL